MRVHRETKVQFPKQANGAMMPEAWHSRQRPDFSLKYLGGEPVMQAWRAGRCMASANQS